jgi:hypothetical protein
VTNLGARVTFVNRIPGSANAALSRGLADRAAPRIGDRYRDVGTGAHADSASAPVNRSHANAEQGFRTSTFSGPLRTVAAIGSLLDVGAHPGSRWSLRARRHRLLCTRRAADDFAGDSATLITATGDRCACQGSCAG